MGRLSTHVLDTMHGLPARDVAIELHFIVDEQRQLLVQTKTNTDGRCSEPLLQGEDLRPGVYELVFHAGDYFAQQGVAMTEPRFVDQVVLRFGVADVNENYHVPLLVTPWSWTTYRGS